MSDTQAQPPLRERSAQERWNEIHQRESFRQLTYAQQMEARSYMLNTFIEEGDPIFANMERDQLSAAYNELLSRPPAFENPEIDEFARTVMEEWDWADVAIHGAWHGISSGGTLGGFIGRTFGDAASRMLTGHGADDILMGTDADKLRDYIILQHEHGGSARLANTAFNLTSTAADLFAYIKTAGAASQRLGERIGARAAQGVSQQRLSAWVANLGPYTTTSLTGTAYLTATQEISRAMQGRESQFMTEYGIDWDNFTRTFGRNFGVSMIASHVIGAVGWGSKAAFRMFTGKGAQGSYAEELARQMNVSTDQAEDIIRMQMIGNISEEQLRQLPDFAADHIRATQRVGAISNSDLSTLRTRPIDATYLEAAHTAEYARFNEALDDAGNQVFRFYSREMDGAWMRTDLTSIGEVREHLGRAAIRHQSFLEKTGDTNIASWREANERLLNWGTRSMDLDGVYEASATAANASLGDGVSRPKDFLSMLDRPYISQAELRHLQGSIDHVDGQLLRFNTPDTDAILNRLNRGLRPFDGAETLRVTPTETGTVVAPALRIADGEAAAQIDNLVARAVQSGSTMDPAALRKFYALDSGYDAIRHADGTAEILLPHKARIVSELVDDTTGQLHRSAAAAANAIADPAAAVARHSDVATEATVRQNIVARLGLEEASKDDRLIAEISAQKLKGAVQQQDARTIARMYMQRNNIPVENISIKLSTKANSLADGSERVARAAFRDGNLEIQLPKAITNLDTQERVVTELFDDLAVAVRAKSETAAEAAARNFRRGVDQIGDPAIRRQTAAQADRMVAREAARGSGSARPHRGTYYRKLTEESTRRFEIPIDGSVNQRSWLQDIARRMGGDLTVEKGGRVLVRLPGQNPARFDTLGEAYDAMMIQNMDVGYLKYDLGRQGYKMTELPRRGGFRVEGPGLSEPFEARTSREIMEHLNYRPQRVDMAFGPRVMEVSDDAVTLQIHNNRVVGNHQQLLRHLDNFEDTQKMARSTRFRSLEHAEIRQMPGGHLEIEIPETGSYLQFADRNAALQFARTDWDTWEGYRFMAANKGFDLTYHQGSWILDNGHSQIRATGTAELKKALRSVPDPRAAPDIFAEIDPELSREINNIIMNGDAPSLATSGMRATQAVYYDPPQVNQLDSQFQTIGDAWRSQLASNRKFFEGLNDRFPEITKLYRQMESGSRIANSEHARALRVVDNIFRNPEGKLMDINARRAVLAFREAGDDPQRLAQAIADFGEPTADIERATRLIGELFGTYDPATGAATGLFGKFGVPAERFLDNYMPRLRTWALSVGPDVKNGMINGTDILDAARNAGNLDARAVSQLRPFFEHMRSAEALQFIRETDPYELVRTYSSLGHRKLYIGDTWSEMSRYLREHTSEIPAAITNRVEQYRNIVAGTHRPIGSEWIADMGENFMRRMGATDPGTLKAGRQVFERLQMMQHGTNLVWRPFLAVRNAFQPFTTLAPKFGNARVMNAMRDVANAGEEWFDQARIAGIFNDSPPIVNQLHDIDSKLGGFVRRGMSMFTRSDQWTRAVAYRVGDSVFEEAIERVGRGAIQGADQFADYIQLRKFAPDMQERIMGFIRQGDYATARQVYAVEGVTNSMFDYARSGQPGFHQSSVFGQLFGQYGTYSAGYRDMIADGFRYGTYADRAAFIGTFVANHAALYAAFQAVGIDGSSFIPGGPALFGGGPNFDLAMNALQSFDGGYKGQRARYELSRAISPIMVTSQGVRGNIPRNIPIARQMSWVQQGLEYLERGDTYNAWLSFTMTPSARE